MLTSTKFYEMTNDAVRPVLDGMANTELVTLYNDITGSKVKKFSSKEDGLRRIWRARREQFAKMGVDGNSPVRENPTTTENCDAMLEVGAAYVAEGGEVIAEQPVGTERAQELAKATGSVEVTVTDGDTKVVSQPEQPKTTPKISKPTRKENDVTTRIRLLNNVNPKKAGTKAFDRYELYVDEMTVAEALAEGITREDIRWDSKHGHIRLEEVASAPKA